VSEIAKELGEVVAALEKATPGEWPAPQPSRFGAATNAKRKPARTVLGVSGG